MRGVKEGLIALEIWEMYIFQGKLIPIIPTKIILLIIGPFLPFHDNLVFIMGWSQQRTSSQKKYGDNSNISIYDIDLSMYIKKCIS